MTTLPPKIGRESLVLDQDRMELWREASETELRQAWSPFSVRRAIEDLGDSALIDRDAHAALCAFGVHLSAPALDLTYNLQPRVQIGPSNFAIPGLFLVLKELAFLHSGVLRLVVGFLTVPTSEQTTAESISRSLSDAMGSVRATNYREEIARLSAVGSTASREQSESISAVPGKNRRRRNKSPFQRWRKFRRSAIGSDDHPEVDIHRLLRTTAQELHKELTEHR